MDVRRPARWARACVLELLGVGRRARGRLDGSRAAVLMYHRVLPRLDAHRNSVEPGMYVDPATFAHHLRWVEAHFRVLPLHEIVQRLAAGLPLPAGACAITFDDGWRDNWVHAAPELARRGLPATLFVVTGRMGTPGTFWPEEVFQRMKDLPGSEQRKLAARLGAGSAGDPAHALLSHLKSLTESARGAALDAFREAIPRGAAAARELLDWDELDRVAQAGIDVEAHGTTHAILSGMPASEVNRELASALAALRERGHGRHALLAYPNGGHDEQVRRIAREVGYRGAVTTSPGLVDRQSDLLAMPRVALHDDVSRTRVEFLERFASCA